MLQQEKNTITVIAGGPGNVYHRLWCDLHNHYRSLGHSINADNFLYPEVPGT